MSGVFVLIVAPLRSREVIAAPPWHVPNPYDSKRTHHDIAGLRRRPYDGPWKSRKTSPTNAIGSGMIANTHFARVNEGPTLRATEDRVG